MVADSNLSDVIIKSPINYDGAFLLNKDYPLVKIKEGVVIV